MRLPCRPAPGAQGARPGTLGLPWVLDLDLGLGLDLDLDLGLGLGLGRLWWPFPPHAPTPWAC